MAADFSVHFFHFELALFGFHFDFLGLIRIVPTVPTHHLIRFFEKFRAFLVAVPAILFGYRPIRPQPRPIVLAVRAHHEPVCVLVKGVDVHLAEIALGDFYVDYVLGTDVFYATGTSVAFIFVYMNF